MRIKNGLSKEDANVFLTDLKLQLEFWISTIREVAQNFSSVVFIIRPHPSVSPSSWQEIVDKHELKNAVIETTGTAEDWSVQADLVLSNFSTVIHYCNLVDVNAFILRDSPLIEQINSDWLQKLPCLKSSDEIINALATMKKPDISLWKNYTNDHVLCDLRNIKSVQACSKPLSQRLMTLTKFIFNRDFIKYLLLSLRLYRKSSIERDRFKLNR